MPFDSARSGPDRRRLLKGGAAGTVMGAVGIAAGVALPATPASAATADVAAFTSTDPLRHLLRRATYGATPQSEAELRGLGAVAWLDRQLQPATIDDAVCDSFLTRFPLLNLDIAGVRAEVTAGRLPVGAFGVMQDLARAAVARATWSNRQLLEVMVDFWSNHLNVTTPSSDVWDNRHTYDRMIRASALGRFVDLLKGSAFSPAMLSYLDNRSSTKANPNENYGRELLELHTVGMVYTEADVAQAARLLTGMTVDRKTGQYRYDANQHAVGPVTVLGFSHPNATAAGGEAAVSALLDYLAMHPATAARIARKLCVRFVSDDPPAALISRLAQVYLTAGSAVAPVLRALFTSPEFAASIGAKVRTPMEDLVATLRVLGITPEPIDAAGGNPAGTEAIRALEWTLQSAGHAPMRWGTPDGYPDVAALWASTTGYLVRWNAHLNIAANWYPKQLGRPESMVRYLLPTLPTTYGGLVDAVALRLVGMRLRPEHTAALLSFLGKAATTALKPTDNALNGKFGYLVALVLDSPYFSVR
jgi:uncharacterized protein (DUF1800 family)